jgi:hypothetical protein
MNNSTFHGPLRCNPANPRYFTDDTGTAIYLTGSHTWATLVDMRMEGDAAFDWLGFLDMAQAHGHNFMRLGHLCGRDALRGLVSQMEPARQRCLAEPSFTSPFGLESVLYLHAI